MALSYGDIFFRNDATQFGMIINSSTTIQISWVGCRLEWAPNSHWSLNLAFAKRKCFISFQFLAMFDIILYPVYRTWASPVRNTSRGGNSLPHYLIDSQGSQYSIFHLEEGSFKLDTQI